MIDPEYLTLMLIFERIARQFKFSKNVILANQYQSPYEFVDHLFCYKTVYDKNRSKGKTSLQVSLKLTPQILVIFA